MPTRDVRPVRSPLHTTRPMALPVLLVMLVLPAAGCIGVQSNSARTFERFPPPQNAGDSQYPLDVSVRVNTVGVPADRALRATLPTDVRNAYVFHLNRTDRVTARDGDTPPYRAEIQVLDRGGDRGSVAAAAITLVTLYLVPSWSTQDYTTTVRLRDPSGRSLGAKTWTHRVRLVQQLFLAFGMPFAGLQDAYDRMWSEVMRDAAAWTVERLDETGP